MVIDLEKEPHAQNFNLRVSDNGNRNSHCSDRGTILGKRAARSSDQNNFWDAQRTVVGVHSEQWAGAPYKGEQEVKQDMGPGRLTPYNGTAAIGQRDSARTQSPQETQCTETGILDGYACINITQSSSDVDPDTTSHSQQSAAWRAGRVVGMQEPSVASLPVRASVVGSTGEISAADTAAIRGPRSKGLQAQLHSCASRAG